jgi:hypothetical protein
MRLKQLLDNLSIKPKLLINGNERYTSSIGVIMTTLSMIAVTVLAGYFLITFFSRRDLSVIYFKDSNNFIPHINLNETFFMFYFRDVNNDPIDPRVAELVPTYWTYTNDVRNISFLETEPCNFDTNMNDPYYKTLFSFNITKYSCIKDPGRYNLTMTSLPAEGNRRYFNFYMRRCTNSTDNNNHCYPPDDLDTKLKALNMYIEYYFPNYIYNHYNFTNPIQLWYLRSQYKITSEFFYNYYDYFKLLEYESDNGNVFEDYVKFNAFTYDDISSKREMSGVNTKVYIANAFAVLQINVTANFLDRYKRFYPKLQTVVANIGGVIKFVFFLAKIISSYLTKQMMLFHLSSCIIDYNDFCDNNKPMTNDNPSHKIVNFINENNNGNNNGNNKMEVNTLKLTKVNPARRRFRLRFIDAFCPYFLRKSATKQFLEESDIVIRKHLSIDFILTLLSEFDRLKKILLTDNQYELFRNSRKPSVIEHKTRLFDDRPSINFALTEKNKAVPNNENSQNPMLKLT